MFGCKSLVILRRSIEKAFQYLDNVINLLTISGSFSVQFLIENDSIVVIECGFYVCSGDDDTILIVSNA